MPRPAPPSDALLLSSRGAGWSGLRVEQRRVAEGSGAVRAGDAPLVFVHLGQSHRLWQASEGRLHDGPHQRGDVVVVAAGEQRTMRWDRPSSFVTLALDAATLRQAARALDLDPDRASIAGSFVRRDARVEHLAQALLHEIEAGAPGGPLYGDSLATALAAHLLTSHAAARAARPPRPEGLAPAALRRVTDHVRAHLASPLSLDDLASVAGLSPYHFARQFQRATGEPPHRYVLRARVEEARRLLLAGSASPAEASALVGFSSQSHLGRQMRKLLGTSPGALARLARR